ncbi:MULTISPECIES: exosortase A [Kordiimonas]|jgi:exosortase A|uniref:exosortase A n=1 Tax=Kordiimonas TaxID=288021 RepID=UPI00257D2270|nr:exosortase A [Kordiimonas sp. UBA4487]
MAVSSRLNLSLLGAGLLLLVLAWFDTLRHMATLVWTVDTFSHGIWVPVVSVWLIWRDRVQLANIPIRFWWPGSVGLAFVSCLWLLGGAAEAKIVQHVAFIGAIQFLVVACLGRAIYRALLFPLLFLFAFVPFGGQLVGPLQVFTAKITIWALDVTGVAHQSDGVLIRLSSGLFEVAAACAGVKFLFSSLVTGILLCRLAFRSWRRRVVMLVASVIVPIFANVARVYGTLLISEATDISFAKDVDHIVYGWGFLSFVLIILIAAAYKFSDIDNTQAEEDQGPVYAVGEHSSQRPAFFAVIVSLLLVLFSAWWLPADPEKAFTCNLTRYKIPQCDGCGIRALSPDVQAGWLDAPSADHSRAWMYRLEADTVFGVTALYAPDRVGHRLAASTSMAPAPTWSRLSGQDIEDQSVGAAAFQETVIFSNGRKRLVWQTFYVDGQFFSSPIGAKLALAILRLKGQDAVGQMLVAAAEFPSTGEYPRAILTRFFETFSPSTLVFDLGATGQEKNVCVA